MAAIVVVAAGMLALPASLGNAVFVVVGYADIGDPEMPFASNGWGYTLADMDGTDGWGKHVGDLGVVWGKSADDENWATVTFPMPDNFCGSLQSLRIKALDGVADDSFKVSVWDTTREMWNDIFEYTAKNVGAVEPNWAGGEEWIVHEISLTDDKCVGDGEYDFPRGYPIYDGEGFTVKITALGQKWTMFSSFGQLGVDWIELGGYGVLQ